MMPASQPDPLTVQVATSAPAKSSAVKAGWASYPWICFLCRNFRPGDRCHDYQPAGTRDRAIGFIGRI